LAGAPELASSQTLQAQLGEYSLAAGLGLANAQLDALLEFSHLIAKWDRIMNLVGSNTPNEIVNTHIGDCLMAAPYIGGSSVVDVGSGAGLPGIVLAIARPECTLTLVESNQRKARFLIQVTLEIGLDNVVIAAQRIERMRPTAPIDGIVCRGYSSLRKFHDDTRALHVPGLKLYAMKGMLKDQEIAEVRHENIAIDIRRLNVRGWDHRHLVTMHCGG
jgi:16S rRNA (guanine527-N7)-methyltransferase